MLIENNTNTPWSSMIRHRQNHTGVSTINVLNLYSPLIRVGDYFIVEDSINYDGVFANQDFGVANAIKDFVAQGNFISDRSVITWNPCVFLKRVQ